MSAAVLYIGGRCADLFDRTERAETIGRQLERMAALAESIANTALAAAVAGDLRTIAASARAEHAALLELLVAAVLAERREESRKFKAAPRFQVSC
jgi:phage gp46-like protein